MSYINYKVKYMIDLNNVGFVLASKYRKIIMESLLDSNKTIKEISDECDVGKRLLYAPAKSLRDYGLVVKKERTYAINDEGAEVINFIHEKWGK